MILHAGRWDRNSSKITLTNDDKNFWIRKPPGWERVGIGANMKLAYDHFAVPFLRTPKRS